MSSKNRFDRGSGVLAEIRSLLQVLSPGRCNGIGFQGVFTEIAGSRAPADCDYGERSSSALLGTTVLRP